MNANSVLASLSAGSATYVIASTPDLTGGQNWTLLGVLVMVLGACGVFVKWLIDRLVTAGDKQVQAVDAHTKAMVEVATELRLLTEQERTSRATADEFRKELWARIERIPEDVAKVLRASA